MAAEQVAQPQSSVESTENALRDFKHNFETFFNTIDELLFVLDDQGRILYANDTVIQRLGYTREEMVGQSVLMVHPPERRAEALQITLDMLAGKVEFCPVPVQTKDGLQIPVETRVKVGEWDGKPVLFGVTKDISRLKLSEEKFSKAFHSNAALMALSYAETGLFLDVNEAFLKTLGYTREEVIGHSSRELGLFFDPRIREEAMPILKSTGQIRNFEVQIRTKDGRLLDGLFSGDRLYVGDTPCLLTMMTDITARKAGEKKERQAREFAEAMHDVALALNSTLDLDQVFDRILGNLKRVLDCDSANILMLEGDQLRVTRSMHNVHTGKLFPIALFPILEQAAQNAAPVIIADVGDLAGRVALPALEWIRSSIAAPIIMQNEVIGFIHLSSATPGFYSEEHLGRLRAFADQAAMALNNARLYARVTELATTDTLTGLFNRRHFIELTSREIARAKRYQTPLSAVMFDLDRFKKINDRYGHLAGDRVLVEVANLCKGSLRSMDIACRYGGDEMTIVLPNTDLGQAAQFAERLRSLISELRIRVGDKTIKISASIGVASFQPDDQSLEDLLLDADRALYRAKQRRNRISVYEVTD